jgi:hypothetical protein
MSNLIPFFPSGENHDRIGFNDSGIEQFKRDRVESFVRECVQNSTDAWDLGEEPVKVTFTLHQLNLEEFPWATKLVEHFKSCLNALESEPDKRQDPKAIKFFQHALELIKAKSLSVMVVSDENTTGVEGKDEDKSSFWSTLVMARGSSSKNSIGAGGSFGIGKSAPFACSPLRTIIYSTKTKDGVAIFGKSMLISHDCPEKGDELYGVGYLGLLENGRIQSLRNPGDIPKFLRRQKNGTDIAVLGFEDNDWAEKIRMACIKHFWPALNINKVVFEIKDGTNTLFTINKDSLKSDIAWLEDSKWRDEDESSYFTLNEAKPSQFLSTFNDQVKYELNLPHGAKGKLWLRVGRPGEGLPARVCCFRTNAMIIQYKTIKGRPGNWCAVFHSDTVEGAKMFRIMEPPTHAEWTYEEPEDQDEKKKCKEILYDLYKQIREKLDELMKATNGQTILPDEIDIKLEDEGGGENGEDTFDPTDFSAELPASEKKMQIRKSKTDGSGKGGGSGGGDGDGGGDSDGGGDGDGDGDGASSHEEVSADRAFLVKREKSACIYKAILSGNSDGILVGISGLVTGHDKSETPESITEFVDINGAKINPPIKITKSKRTIYFRLPGSPLAVGVVPRFKNI